MQTYLATPTSSPQLAQPTHHHTASCWTPQAATCRVHICTGSLLSVSCWEVLRRSCVAPRSVCPHLIQQTAPTWASGRVLEGRCRKSAAAGPKGRTGHRSTHLIYLQLLAEYLVQWLINVLPLPVHPPHLVTTDDVHLCLPLRSEILGERRPMVPVPTGSYSPVQGSSPSGTICYLVNK